MCCTVTSRVASFTFPTTSSSQPIAGAGGTRRHAAARAVGGTAAKQAASIAFEDSRRSASAGRRMGRAERCAGGFPRPLFCEFGLRSVLGDKYYGSGMCRETTRCRLVQENVRFFHPWQTLPPLALSRLSTLPYFDGLRAAFASLLAQSPCARALYLC